jgi:YbbR domain-containing protein
VVGVRGEGIDPAKWTVTPAQVEVTLTGALLAVEKAKAAMAPVVKLTTGEGKPHEVDVVIDGLPPGIGVKISPERVKVSPAKPAPPPPSP